MVKEKRSRTIPITEPVDGEIQGPAGVFGECDVARSPYYLSPDFFEGGVSDTLLILPRVKTYQQTSERSCAAVYVEKAFTSRGFIVESSRTLQGERGKSFAADAAFAAYIRDNLLQKNAMLVESVDQGGHWKILIGYDDMGTPALADDVLVFADPYDIFDHCQNGYTISSFQRFFYGWVDAGVISPGISYQQFVTVKHPGSLPAKAQHNAEVSKKYRVNKSRSDCQ